MPSSALTSLALALALIVSTASQAQQRNLTRAQEGRVEVAKCYARCLKSAEPMTYVRIALDALDGKWSTSTFQYVACLNDQTVAQRQDACRSGCVDIEATYGVRSSYIRTRYLWHFNSHIREVRAAGLWNAWNRFPEPGSDAFIRACARYIQSQQTRSATAARKLESVEPENVSVLKARRQEVIADEYRPELPPATDFDLYGD